MKKHHLLLLLFVVQFSFAQEKTIPKKDADRYVKPQVEMIAHAADLGMMFYTGKQFPKKYHNAIFFYIWR